jgi:hypothetical protein
MTGTIAAEYGSEIERFGLRELRGKLGMKV